MQQSSRYHSNKWRLVPVWGSVVFLLLYFLAASFYPGGSQHNHTTAGFSWLHNYWCNLLNVQALNGQPNGGRPFALAGMIVLAASLLFFWVTAAVFFYPSKVIRTILIVCGTLSILLLTQLSSIYHDSIINAASFFGLLSTAGVYGGLLKKGWRSLFVFGVFNLLLVGLNNYLYYTEGMFHHLPLVQKITFLSWLVWIDWVSLRLYRQSGVAASGVKQTGKE